MALIGLFYGTTDGMTAQIAARLAAHIAAAHRHEVEVYDIGEFYLEEIADFDYLILGIPTWNTGQMQADWEASLDELDNLDLSGKAVAIFGLGDQAGYPTTFVDAMFFVADKVQAQGAHLVGRWPTAGYAFESSWAVVDGDFVGLAIDELNQPELTEARLIRWAQIVLAEFGV